jgi:hypothetical protein
MKKKSFNAYLNGKKIKLEPWQQEAATAFLQVCEKQQQGRTGKTFLLKVLTEFTNEHGNNFELP